MATPTPSNNSHKSLENFHDEAGDHEIHPEKPQQQQESSFYNDNEVVKGDQTKKSSILSQAAALPVVLPPTDISITSVVGKGRLGSNAEDESGRERLKRHRMEMAGCVRIPDTWGQEILLKNWIDCTAFDASLVNNSILSARAALMRQRGTTNSTNNLTLQKRIENRC